MGTRILIGSIAGFLVALTLATGCSRPPPPKPLSGRGNGEDPLASARELLQNPGDHAACRSAILSLNQHINQMEKANRPEVTEDLRKLLATRYGLNADEIGEVTLGNLTTLDTTYLESCLLFRDAALALGLEGQPPAERATAAWHWCMRQVRLREREGGTVPPHLVLRRGWGNALERSLVFTALLQQLGLTSCLVTLPGSAEDQPRYWACGVLVPGDKGPDILLFDPRLGLPLPGPQGRGTATLAQLKTDASLLTQLHVESLPYDVTAEQVRSAEIRLAAPLSSLAPRHRLVEELLGPGLRIRLAFDAATLLKQFDEAVAQLPEGSRPPVRVASRALGSLRAFLTSPEGGTATARAPILDIPFEYFPNELKIGGDLGRDLLNYYVRPFQDFALEVRMPRHEYLRGRFIYLGQRTNADADRMPFDVSVEAAVEEGANKGATSQRDKLHSVADKVGVTAGSAGAAESLDRARMPRDLILRGRLEEAAKLLVSMQTQLRTQRERLARMSGVGKELAAWQEKVTTAQANLLRAQKGELPLERARLERDATWAEGQRLWLPILEGTVALPMLAEVNYQLALCNHDKAERLQTRLARSKTPTETLVQEVRAAWREAAHAWDTFLEVYGNGPLAGVARRGRARVHEAIGNREEAARLLQVQSPDLGPLERLARAWEARRLQTP